MLPTMGTLFAESSLSQGAFFTHLGPFFGKGISDAAVGFRKGKVLREEALLWAKLDTFRDGATLTLQAHPENYRTQSAPGEMSRKHRLFLVGRLTECDTNALRAQAYIVGHLHEEPRQGVPSVDRLGRLPWQMEVFPSMVDTFAAAEGEVEVTTQDLNKLLTIPEVDIKTAFASSSRNRIFQKTGEESGPILFPCR
jgi:hypothetical protein